MTRDHTSVSRGFCTPLFHHNRKTQAGAIVVTFLGIIGSATTPAMADNTSTPTAVCTRPGFPGTASGNWTCTVPLSNGGQAVISGVPPEAGGSSVDLAVLNDWVASSLGSKAMIFGDITSSATGENAVAIGAGATANVANSVAIGAGSVAQAAIGTSSTTIAGQTYSFAGSTPIGTVSVGQAGAERTITSVAAGQVSAASTDAVNGSQLHATNQAVEALDNKAVKYDQNPDGTRSNTITLQGGDPSQPVVITNVAAGVNATDAVNVAQLNEILNGSPGQSYSYVDNRIAIAFEDVKNYTEQKIAALYGDIDDIRDDARSAAAIGLAAASLRYDDNPGKLSVAVGGGFWRGQSAFAVGAGYTNDDATVRANLSGTAAGGRVGVGAGLSFTLN